MYLNSPQDIMMVGARSRRQNVPISMSNVNLESSIDSPCMTLGEPRTRRVFSEFRIQIMTHNHRGAPLVANMEDYDLEEHNKKLMIWLTKIPLVIFVVSFTISFAFD